MIDNNDDVLGHCPECGASRYTKAPMCWRCGAFLSDPFEKKRTSRHKIGWSLTLAMGLETLIIVAILSSILGAIWLMRPQAQFAAEQPALRFTPTPLPTSTDTPTPVLESITRVTETPTPTAIPSFIIHTVEPGDTLIEIAQTYNVRLDTLLEANQIDEDDFLRIGQELLIPLNPSVVLPTATPTPLPASGFNVITHTVKPGDTLSELAAEYDTSIDEIIEANELNGELLKVGDVLIIPGAPITPPPTPTLPPTATPTITPLPTAVPASPTPTPAFARPAPQLLAPPDDVLLTGKAVSLHWTSVGVLDDESWYVVQVWTARPGEPEISQEAWVKSTSWRIPEELAPEPGTTQRYRWRVTVQHRSGEETKALSPASETRTFRWEMQKP